MKKIVYLAVAVWISACTNKPADKKAELEKLKSDRMELNLKIAKLEVEVGTTASVDETDVLVSEVKESLFRSYVEVQGRIDAKDNVMVNPEAQGVVTAVYVRAGQNVSKGQVLAQIDDAVLRQNMAQLQTQIDYVTNIYNRQKNLWDQKIGTEVQFINAKSQKDGLERQMAVLNSQLNLYKVKSPISGTIDQMDLKLGQAIMPGNSGIRVINTNNLKVKALIAESYAGRVNQGDQVAVIFPDIPDSLSTTLNFASKVIDPVSRSFTVEVKLPSKSSYRTNMLAVLKITDYRNLKALVIPVNAIQRAENGDYVFVAENGKAKKVIIRSGKFSDGQAEIVSGLKAGDKVIVKGMKDLDEGDTIKF